MQLSSSIVSLLLIIIGIYATIIPTTMANTGVDNFLINNIVQNKIKNNDNLKQLRIECDFVTCTQ
tara:strand:+ start:98 stop:292 length:195 start_codon:yes stop_codon:yes gene_type:complete